MKTSQRKAMFAKLRSSYGQWKQVRPKQELKYGLIVPRQTNQQVAYAMDVPMNKAIVLEEISKDKRGKFTLAQYRGDSRGWVEVSTIVPNMSPSLAKTVLLKRLQW